MGFQSTKTYIASDGLKIAVNASIALQKPLIVKGEPGTGKTLLAEEIAQSLGKKLISWNVKSTTTAQQGLYEYDAVSRLRDSQLGDEKVNDIANYIVRGKLWEAFDSDEQVILLIDEVDKADIEFPNDLLQELDKMEFYCYELKKTIHAKIRPIIIITSNNEKELPDAFLRRCLFHYITFPDRDTLKTIIDVHYEGLEDTLINSAMRLFYDLRNIRGMKKRPSTSEIIDWIKLLTIGKITAKELDGWQPGNGDFPFSGALVKNEQDLVTLKI